MAYYFKQYLEAKKYYSIFKFCYLTAFAFDLFASIFVYSFGSGISWSLIVAAMLFLFSYWLLDLALRQEQIILEHTLNIINPWIVGREQVMLNASLKADSYMQNVIWITVMAIAINIYSIIEHVIL